MCGYTVRHGGRAAVVAPTYLLPLRACSVVLVSNGRGDGLARGGACNGGMDEEGGQRPSTTPPPPLPHHHHLHHPPDHALEPTNPHATTQPHKCERATYARPDNGNESEMLWTVLKATKERRASCCRNTRSDEEGDAR